MTGLRLSGYDVYSKVADNATKGFIAQLVGTAFTYWLAGAWRLGSILLFCFFVAVSLQELVQVAIVLFPGDNTRGADGDHEFPIWWRRSKYVRVGSLLITIGLLWFLYRRIW